MRHVELTGKTFHWLKVLERDGLDNSGNQLWKCRCKCGEIRYVISSNLKKGNTKSCGCWRQFRMKKVGKARTVKR